MSRRYQPKGASGRYGRTTNDYRDNSGLAVERTVRPGGLPAGRGISTRHEAPVRAWSGRMMLPARSAPDVPPRTVGLPRWVSLRI